MAKAESRSITRRSLVAGSVALAAGFPSEGAVARMEQSAIRDAFVPAGSAPDVADASSGLQAATPDPIYAAIEAHASAYAAYVAYQKAEPGDEVGLEPLIEVERAAAEAFAATVPATLAGAAAALSHVHLLHARDNYPLLDDYWCYVFIASADAALRCALGRDGKKA